MMALIELLQANPWPLYAAAASYAIMLAVVLWLAWLDLTGRLT